MKSEPHASQGEPHLSRIARSWHRQRRRRPPTYSLAPQTNNDHAADQHLSEIRNGLSSLSPPGSGGGTALLNLQASNGNLFRAFSPPAAASPRHRAQPFWVPELAYWLALGYEPAFPRRDRVEVQTPTHGHSRLVVARLQGVASFPSGRAP